MVRVNNSSSFVCECCSVVKACHISARGGKVYSLVQRNPSSVYQFDSRDTLVSFMARNIPPITDKFATMYELDFNDWIIRGSFFRRPNKASRITN